MSEGKGWYCLIRRGENRTQHNRRKQRREEKKRRKQSKEKEKGFENTCQQSRSGTPTEALKVAEGLSAFLILLVQLICGGDAKQFTAMPYNAIQCSVLQCSAVQCSAVQCSTVEYVDTLHIDALSSAAYNLHLNSFRVLMHQLLRSP